MRATYVIVVLWMAALLLGCASNKSVPLPPAPTSPSALTLVDEHLPELRAELLAMARLDQEARAPTTQIFRPGAATDSAIFARVAARIDSVDTANRARLKQLIRHYGWLGIDLVGRDGMSAGLMLVQHGDRHVPLQKEYLLGLERAFHAGKLFPEAADAVALLTDRVRVNEGRPQVYGTQVSFENGRAVLKPIEDEARVDDRRAALGLPPLSEYLQQLRAFYGLQP